MATEHYRGFVAAYLASEQGRDTPDSVALALFTLDPDVCGFDLRLCTARLHTFRELIQDVHAQGRQAPAWKPRNLYGRRYSVALVMLRQEMADAETIGAEPLRKAG